jgi:hypothetical protein
VKRFIVIFILLILVGGGGAGALIMLKVLPNPFNPAPQGMTAAEAAASAADAKKKVFVPPSEAMTFVDVRDMIIPVVIGTNVERKVYLSVRMHVVKDEKDAVELQIARYENAILDTFIPYFQNYFVDKDVIDPAAVKKQLRSMAKKLYGDKVLDVLLINIFEQRFGSMK